MIPAGALPLAAQQFGCPVSLFDYATILQAIDDQVEEGEEVDFKRELYAWQGGTKDTKTGARAELAKDVTAFANHRGGLLVMGVADVNDRASKAMPVATTGRFDAWVRSTVATWVAPMPTVEVIQLDDPDDAGQGFYVIAVLSSQDRPHAVVDPSDPERPLRFPVRVGRETMWWSAAQVRMEHAHLRERLDRRGLVLDEVMSTARPALSDKLWALAVVVPDVVGDWPVGFDRLREVKHTWLPASIYYDATLPAAAVPIIGGIRQHDPGQQPGEVANWLIDRYEDGSSLTASELATQVKDGVAGFGGDQLTDALLLSIRVGLEHARSAGCYGLATVSATLWWDTASYDVALIRQQRMGQVSVPRVGEPMAGDLDTLGVPKSLPIPSDDGDAATLLVARRAMAPTFQRLGEAEVGIITGDGAISLSHASPAQSGHDRIRQRVEALGWRHSE